MPTREALAPMSDALESTTAAELARVHGRLVFSAAYRVLGDAAGAIDGAGSLQLSFDFAFDTAVDPARLSLEPPAGYTVVAGED